MRNFKKLILLTMIVLSTMLLAGCGMQRGDSLTSEEVKEVEITYNATFYTNSGEVWFETVGKNIDIKPNKVKEWGYNTDGSWTSWYETSSIVSIYIDGNQMDSCGSTVIFADSRLVPCNVDFESIMSDSSSEASMNAHNSRFSNYIALRNWWIGNRTNGSSRASRLIVIQSQEGDPIAMYQGNEVTWSLGELPKTTLILIDDMKLYVHRSNFAVIDTDMIQINYENKEE